MYVPPPEEQDDVEIQILGAPPLPVRGPFPMILTRMEEDQASPAKEKKRQVRKRIFSV
jgi:hypothetical protein